MTNKRNTRELPFFDMFEKFISCSKSGRRVQPNGKAISKGTLENYCNTKRLLQHFCTDRQFLLRLRPVKYLNKKQLIVEKNYWKKFYKKFTDYLYHDLNHFDNYVAQNIKIIKVFFNYLNKDLLIGIGEFHKLFYVINEQIPIVTLLPEELNFLIYDQVFEAGLSGRMQKVKDLFVFGCTVALRFSDLVSLKRKNLRIGNDNYYLIVRSKKTATDTKIKLPDYVIKIIKKYEDKFQTILPYINIVDFNWELKELIEKAGFIQTFSKMRTKRGKQKEIMKQMGTQKKEYRFCDLITTHTMRRTAITVMLSLGVPEQLVRKISGHSPMSKEFFRYVSFAQSFQDKETEKMFEQLKRARFA